MLWTSLPSLSGWRSEGSRLAAAPGDGCRAYNPFIMSDDSPAIGNNPLPWRLQERETGDERLVVRSVEVGRQA